MLLVLMTITAVAMSKNALREVVITGTSRQGAQVRNLADSGIEWSIYWMMDDLTNTRPSPTSTSSPGALELRDTKADLVAQMKTGVVSDEIYNAKDMKLTAEGVNPAQYFKLYLTYMGNPKLKFTQADVHASSISAAASGTVQLWAIRSDGYIDYSSGPTFLHRREAWFTLPPGAQH